MHVTRTNAYRISLLTAELPIAILFFFFQAEDGIRDLTVTGVQTCALPILIQHRNLHRRRYVLRCRHEGIRLHVGISTCDLWRRGRPREVHHDGARETNQGRGPDPGSRPPSGDRGGERAAIPIDPPRTRDGRSEDPEGAPGPLLQHEHGRGSDRCRDRAHAHLVHEFRGGDGKTNLRSQARSHGPFARTPEALETGTTWCRVRDELVDGKGRPPRL